MNDVLLKHLFEKLGLLVTKVKLNEVRDRSFLDFESFVKLLNGSAYILRVNLYEGMYTKKML